MTVTTGVDRFEYCGSATGEAVHRDDLHPVTERLGRGVEPGLECLLRSAPATANNLDAPVLVLVRVKSMMTVTSLSPARVRRRTRSSTPTVVTPSSRSALSVPAARIASEAVFQATPRLAETRAIDTRSTTTDFTATMIASRDSFPRESTAAVML